MGDNHNEGLKEKVVAESLIPTEVTTVGNSWHISYPQLGLTLHFSKMNERKDGLRAEVRVEGKDENDNPIIYDSCQYTLTARTSRDAFAKHLSKRIEPEVSTVDWEGLAMQAFTKVTDTFRIGEPAKQLSSLATVKPLEYLIYPLLPKNMPTTLYSPGGVGKSTFAQMLCALLLAGYSNNELGLKVKNEPQRCLYLDWESDEDEVTQGIIKLANGLGFETEIKLDYRRCWQTVLDDTEEIQRIAAEIKPSLVVIDSVVAAAQSDVNDPTLPAKLLTRDLRQLHTTSLILAHQNKNKEKEKSIYGSIMFFNYSRAVFEMIKDEKSCKGKLITHLVCRKFNRDYLHKPMTFEFNYLDDDMITVERKASLLDSDSLSKALPIQDRIKNLLSRKPSTALELANTFKLSEPTIKKILSDHSDLFLGLGDGKWGVRSNMPSEVYR